MSNVIAENDEPIHHSEGKTILRSCPSVLTSAQSGESSPLISISPPVTISPPDLQHVLEQRKLVWDERFSALWRTIRKFFRKTENTTNIYLFGNLTIIEAQLSKYNKRNNQMIINGNIYNCTIITNDTNNDSHSTCNNKKQEAEEVEYEEVKQDAMSGCTCSVSGKDYSKSPLVSRLSHPEQANYILDRLHRVMDNQSVDREKIKYIKSACEYEVFNARIPYKDYAAEFGSEICQPRYSYLMKDGGKYSKDELKLAFKCIFP